MHMGGELVECLPESKVCNRINSLPMRVPILDSGSLSRPEDASDQISAHCSFTSVKARAFFSVDMEGSGVSEANDVASVKLRA